MSPLALPPNADFASSAVMDEVGLEAKRNKRQLQFSREKGTTSKPVKKFTASSSQGKGRQVLSAPRPWTMIQDAFHLSRQCSWGWYFGLPCRMCPFHPPSLCVEALRHGFRRASGKKPFPLPQAENRRKWSHRSLMQNWGDNVCLSVANVH